MVKNVWIGSLVFFLTACSSHFSNNADPQQRLRDYISKSFAISREDDRKDLESFLIGDAKSRLAAWSTDQFRKAFIENKRQFVKMVLKDVKEVSPKEVHITYEITFIDQTKGQDAKVTNKKLSQLVSENGKWYIREVRNIKELVEYQNEMALP